MTILAPQNNMNWWSYNTGV